MKVINKTANEHLISRIETIVLDFVIKHNLCDNFYEDTEPYGDSFDSEIEIIGDFNHSEDIKELKLQIGKSRIILKTSCLEPDLVSELHNRIFGDELLRDYIF